MQLSDAVGDAVGYAVGDAMRGVVGGKGTRQLNGCICSAKTRYAMGGGLKTPCMRCTDAMTLCCGGCRRGAIEQWVKPYK